MQFLVLTFTWLSVASALVSFTVITLYQLIVLFKNLWSEVRA